MDEDRVRNFSVKKMSVSNASGSKISSSCYGNGTERCVLSLDSHLEEKSAPWDYVINNYIH